MDTQNTPVHIKLWHKEFWMLATANLLLMVSIYMLIPSLPPYLLKEGFSGLQVGMVMGAYGLGIFAFGGFCSYLVQRYRRNHVCQYAIIGVAVCIAILYYFNVSLNMHLDFGVLLIIRFFLGAFLGIAQMMLGSTLIIDTCESFLRTEANHSVGWFARFALSLGPLLALIVFRWFNYGSVLIVSGILLVCALLLISCVNFPFKAPADNNPLFSFDRFFLPQGTLLFINLALITTVVGLILSLPHAELFYGMMMLGFLLALLSERYVFADADLKSEIITGQILLIAAVLIMFTDHIRANTMIAPAMIGFAVGIIGSRFLLFFIKLARHCQRGTSQSTFFLAWEFGMSMGLFLGFSFLGNHSLNCMKGYLPAIHTSHGDILTVGLVLIGVSFLLYNFFVHSWYMRHRNR